jgi:glycosyltransferase involved in cell wall biosynthesis
LKHILFVVTEDWYFVSHRLHMAIHAIENGYKVTLLTRVSNYKSLIESSGIRVIPWNISRRSLNFFNELKAINSILSVMNLHNPDIIHAVALKPIIYSAITSGIKKTKLRIFAMGGLGYSFSSNSFKARLIRYILIFALRALFKSSKVRLILQNQDDIDLLLNYKIISNLKVILIKGVGVNTKEFSPKNIIKKESVIVLPARMLWDKGIAEFVECAKRFKKNQISARFCLVGSPDPENPQSIPVKQINEWVKLGLVEWWGHQEKMIEVYSKATIVCLPSYREGLPKSLLEAASCALPIVAFDVPGCREIVRNGVNGFLVPLKNIDKIYYSILQLINDPALSYKMGINGRKIVLEEFSQDMISEQTMRAWQDIK